MQNQYVTLRSVVAPTRLLPLGFAFLLLAQDSRSKLRSPLARSSVD